MKVNLYFPITNDRNPLKICSELLKEKNEKLWYMQRKATGVTIKL